MKEATTGSGRSAEEREKTKMRERQRRSITTKIFHGLRKHGGYRLSPRADINEVLRELANEAGWIIDPDGTTYRAATTTTNNGPTVCPLCGSGQRSCTPTPTSSVIIGGGVDGCVGDPLLSFGGPTPLYNFSDSGSSPLGAVSSSCDIYRSCLTGGLRQTSAAYGGGGTSAAYDQQQQKLMYFQEARASNQNTPVGSPQRRA